MANLLIIKDLLKEKKISIRDFANELGMTEQALQLLIRKNSTKIETLELIAQKLNISVSMFFEKEIESKNNTSTTNDDLIVTNKNLSETVKSLSHTIENLSRK
ncbi:MAG: helix-turn-helix domain-containing protein [Dysgonomonas sp.]